MNETQIGVLPRRLSLSVSDAKQIAWLATLGAAIALSHAMLKSPLGIPGHHVEWMALLVIARRTSKYSWAATFTSATAAGFAMMPGVAQGFGAGWMTYLAAGAVMDLLFTQSYFKNSVTGVALMAALAHLAKPLIRIPSSLALSIPYKALLVGVFYPIITFFVFGFIGGLIGYGVVSGARKLAAKYSG